MDPNRRSTTTRRTRPLTALARILGIAAFALTLFVAGNESAQAFQTCETDSAGYEWRLWGCGAGPTLPFPVPFPPEPCPTYPHPGSPCDPLPSPYPFPDNDGPLCLCVGIDSAGTSP